MVHLHIPLNEREATTLKAGDEVYLSGKIYTARDRAHRHLTETIDSGRRPPLDLEGQVIYYCGPNFHKGDIGACGPTTSSRMDEFLEVTLRIGVRGVIGKGKRAVFTRGLFKKYRAVYFITYSGCGAYLRRFVKNARLVAFPHLGAEGIYEFEVEQFPVIVGIDTKGKDIYARL